MTTAGTLDHGRDGAAASLPARSAKAALIAQLRTALDSGRGFAAAKFGISEQFLLNQPLISVAATGRQRAAYDAVLRNHCRRKMGVFPDDPGFIAAFTARFAEDLRSLDAVCLMQSVVEPALYRHYRLAMPVYDAFALEPDRSTPHEASQCYLPLLTGKRILLVTPFAELLRERATRQTYERVWSKIGKPWFAPRSVDAVEFPYGVEPATRLRFETVFDLSDDIAARIDAIDFDVALIAAGGLGIGLAAHIKRRGRIALGLGGHLQIVFGVLGERWRTMGNWEKKYFNEWWIDMPARYHPPDKEMLTDGGCYW